MATKTLPKLRKELDKVFSQYIRLRNANSNGATECFTCGKQAHWKELQCGHFQSRRHLNTRFDEENCQVQCVKCNMYSQGEQFKFGLKLDKTFGKGKAEYLQYKAYQTIKMSRVDYTYLIELYKQKVTILTEGVSN